MGGMIMITNVPHSVWPIKLQARLHATIWGGRNLADIAGKDIPSDTLIGESWETETGNLALNEPYRGKSLSELVNALGVALVGTRAAEIFGLRFPLLAKFIDAQDRLSVQVHPNDQYAHEHEGGKLGKTEAWYILHAEPDAQLVFGLERQASADEVRHAIAETRLETLLHSFTVHAGQVVFVPAGTVHAIGAGVVLYELQEYSDVTYRLYDYGRLQSNGKPRDLHLEQGLAVMRYAPPLAETVMPISIAPDGGELSRRVLVACKYFVLEELKIMGTMNRSTDSSSCQIVSVLAGTCELTAREGASIQLGLGDTAVLPAALGNYTLRGADARILLSYVPTSEDKALAMWRAAQPGPIDG